MNGQIEIGVKNWLEGLAAGVEPEPLVVEIIAATGGELRGDVSQVVVRCDRCPRVAGPEGAGGLYDAQVEISVETPSQLATLTAGQHAALVGAVQGLMNEASEPVAVALNDALVAAVGCEFQGWHFEAVEDRHGGGRWVTVLRYVYALVRVAGE